jgi:hypothetical protein
MNRVLQSFLLIVVLAGAVAGYFYWRQNGKPPVAPSAIALSPVPAPEAQIRHPIGSPAAATPLPALDRSDPTLLEALRDQLGAKALALLADDRIIHRIVATVDALPRRQLPVAARPVKPVPGAFVVAGKGDDLAIAAANAARYAPYALLARSVDAPALVGLYRRFYPLFQQAYRELGYPRGYFNDRLVEAIDDLLAAPELDGPVALVQPKVLYQFADPDLESRSAGQKIMVRMGGDNEAMVKAKLRELRQALTGGGSAAR